MTQNLNAVSYYSRSITVTVNSGLQSARLFINSSAAFWGWREGVWGTGGWEGRFFFSHSILNSIPLSTFNFQYILSNCQQYPNNKTFLFTLVQSLQQFSGLCFPPDEQSLFSFTIPLSHKSHTYTASKLPLSHINIFCSTIIVYCPYPDQ